MHATHRGPTSGNPNEPCMGNFFFAFLLPNSPPLSLSHIPKLLHRQIFSPVFALSSNRVLRAHTRSRETWTGRTPYYELDSSVALCCSHEPTMGSFKKEANRRTRDGTDKGGGNLKVKG